MSKEIADAYGYNHTDLISAGTSAVEELRRTNVEWSFESYSDNEICLKMSQWGCTFSVNVKWERYNNNGLRFEYKGKASLGYRKDEKVTDFRYGCDQPATKFTVLAAVRNLAEKFRCEFAMMGKDLIADETPVTWVLTRVFDKDPDTVIHIARCSTRAEAYEAQRRFCREKGIRTGDWWYSHGDGLRSTEIRSGSQFYILPE